MAKLTDVRKNYLINGNFQYWQRGTSLTPHVQHAYGPDRWASQSGIAGSSNTSRQSGGPFSYFYRWNPSATGEFFHINQPLRSEYVDALKGKTVTFSVYIQKAASYADAVVLEIQKNATANVSNGGTWTSIDSTTIQNADLSTAFQRHSVTVTVPNDGTANGLRVVIRGSSGSTAAGQYIEFTGAMLNEGDTAAPFRLASGSPEAELVLCQTYYEKSFLLDTTPNGGNSSTGEAGFVLPAAVGNGGVTRFDKSFKVTKRVVPTMTVYSTVGGAGANTVNVSGTTRNAAASGIGTAGFSYIQNNSGVTWNDTNFIHFHWTADAEL